MTGETGGARIQCTHSVFIPSQQFSAQSTITTDRGFSVSAVGLQKLKHKGPYLPT